MSFNENSKIVVYKGEHFHPTLARNFDVSDPLEWIARITSHIPKKGAKQVIYYGAYSQAWRGRERRQGILLTALTEEKSASSIKDRFSYSGRRRQMWAVLLKKVWDVNALKPKVPRREMPEVRRRDESHLLHRATVCHKSHPETP